MAQQGQTGNIDKETEWFIEPEHTARGQADAKTAPGNILQHLKENLEARMTKKSQHGRNSGHNRPSKTGGLGGLGANIGGE